MRRGIEKERREGEGRDSWDRTNETLCLIFFTAAKNGDKVIESETQITLDALRYYEDDPGCTKHNFRE